MNIEEIKKEHLDFLQAFFVKSFVISFVILLISSLMCILMQDFQMAIVHKYFPIDADDYNFLVLFVFGLWKVFVIQFTLVPAIVIWCMRHCRKCKCQK